MPDVKGQVKGIQRNPEADTQKQISHWWLILNWSGNQTECLSSIVYIFSATVSAGVIALVLGCVLDLSSYQRLKSRVRIIFVVFSIDWSWDEAANNSLHFYFLGQLLLEMVSQGLVQNHQLISVNNHAFCYVFSFGSDDGVLPFLTYYLFLIFD